MKKSVWMILVLTLAAATFVCEAQERREGRNFRRGAGRYGQMRREVRPMSESDAKAWLEVQGKLKKQDAKGYAEVEKLAATNLAAAFNKMQLLAAKAKISTPSQAPRRMMNGRMRGGMGNMGGRRGMGMGGMTRMGGMGAMNGTSARKEAEDSIKAKFPAEFAAYEKKIEENRTYLKDLAKKAKVTLPADFSDLAFIRKKYAAQLQGLDFRASMEKLRELAEKEGYAMGGGNSGRYGHSGRMGNQENTSSALPPPPPKRDFSRNQLARKVRERFPAEWNEYITLRKSDKAAAEKKLEELLKRVK